MKIRVLGFNWTIEGKGSLAGLRAVLEAESKHRMQLLQQSLETGKLGDWDGTLFALTDYQHYWLGVVLKIKDQTQFCQVTKEGGKIRLTAKELERGSKLVEVNFFLVDSKTGNGIYQYYHRSTWVNNFSALCARIVTSHVVSKQNELAESPEAKELTGRELSKAQHDLAWWLTHEIILRKEGFVELVNSLANIKKVTVRLRDDNVTVSKFNALSESANRTAFTFSYGIETSWQRLKNSIKDIVSKQKPWRMRVEGETPDGRFEIIHLASNKEAFDEIDFDEAAKGMEIDLLNLGALLHNDSTMVKKLLITAQKNRVAKMLAS